MDEFYGDGEEPSSTQAPPTEDQEDSGTQTALIPKSLCPGMDPGDVIKLKIESAQEDEYVVSYVKPGKKDEDEGDGDEESMPMQRDSMPMKGGGMRESMYE